MARTKVTVRRLTPAAGEDFRQRTIRPLKIKKFLPQQKSVKEWTNNKNNKHQKKIKVFFR